MVMKQTPGELRFFDLRQSLGVELVWGKQMQHTFSRHTHSSFCIGIVEHGRRILHCRGQCYEILPGQVFIIPPAEPHVCGENKEGHSYRLLLLGPEMLQQMGFEEKYECTSLLLDDRKIFSELRKLHILLATEGDEFSKQSELFSLSGEVMERLGISSSKCSGMKNYGVSRVKVFIETHYAEPLFLEELATLAYTSPYHLIRIFSQEVGIPPHLYQQQVRMRRAKEMLASGMTGSEVALATGFSDQSHFGNVFKKMVGITPGKYGKALSKKPTK